MAFNAKNLTYDKSEPAFLQRLKAGYAAQDGRNNVQHARPTKARLRMDDEDDGPLILDESGQTIAADVYEGMLKGKPITDEVASLERVENDGSSTAAAETKQKVQVTDSERDHQSQPQQQQQKVVEVGVAKKRKAVKVISDHNDGVDEKTDRVHDSKTRLSEDKPEPSSRPAVEASKTRTDKPKKKAKKIKLSFDEPE